MTYQEIFYSNNFQRYPGNQNKKPVNSFQRFRKTHPGGKWDTPIPDKDAEKLLNDLRGEAPGILAWLIKSAMDIAGHTGTA